MASRVKALATGLRKWIKLPWEVTGPISGPEFLSALPKATEYRVTAPATHPQRAIVPHAETERIFDIKYYVRDSRRAPITTTVVDVPATADFEGSAPAVGKFYTMGKHFHINDEPGEGYQK